jgi:DNA-binding beta-propeller fold protein YncE
VQVFDSKGSFLFKFGVLGSGEGDVISPTQIAIDTDEKIYVITEVLFHRGIKVFDSDGNFLFKFGSLDLGDDEFGARSGIAVDSSGRIYVTDRTYHNVQIFDNDGNFLYKFGTLGNNDGQFSIPSGIAVDSTRIYVVDSENNRIQVFQIDEARIPEFPLNLMFIAAVGLMGILIAVRVKNHKLTP